MFTFIALCFSVFQNTYKQHVLCTDIALLDPALKLKLIIIGHDKCVQREQYLCNKDITSLVELVQPKARNHKTVAITQAGLVPQDEDDYS